MPPSAPQRGRGSSRLCRRAAGKERPRRAGLGKDRAWAPSENRRLRDQSLCPRRCGASAQWLCHMGGNPGRKWSLDRKCSRRNARKPFCRILTGSSSQTSFSDPRCGVWDSEQCSLPPGEISLCGATPGGPRGHRGGCGLSPTFQNVV